MPRSVRFSRVRTGGFVFRFGGPVQAVQTDESGDYVDDAFHRVGQDTHQLVRANARNLPPISSTEQAMIRRCTRCLISLSVLLFMFRRFVWCGVRFARSNDGRGASRIQEMKNSAVGGIFKVFVEGSVQALRP